MSFVVPVVAWVLDPISNLVGLDTFWVIAFIVMVIAAITVISHEALRQISASQPHRKRVRLWRRITGYSMVPLLMFALMNIVYRFDKLSY